MARNRMIKPEFWADEKLNSISLESNLLFIALWNFCDDYGFTFNSNRRILGDVFPYREDITEGKIEKWKQELLLKGLLIRIEYAKKEYLVIKNWEKHQTVPNRSKRRYIEGVNITEIVGIYEDSNGENRDYLDTNDCLIRVYFSKEQRERTKRKIKIKETDPEIYRSFDHLQLTTKEFENLISDGLTKKEIDEYCDKVENYKKNKNYKSLNLTIRNWKKKDDKKNEQQTTGQYYDQ